MFGAGDWGDSLGVPNSVGLGVPAAQGGSGRCDGNPNEGAGVCSPQSRSVVSGCTHPSRLGPHGGELCPHLDEQCPGAGGPLELGVGAPGPKS